MNDKEFIRMVMTHYTKYGRHDLVWRKNITPYKILVSEVMLQQTQVSRVVPKFLLWMKTYPTLASLSHASLRDVLILWQGLGYQRRAKALHMLAQSCVRIPKSYDELLLLPGIGSYTASAICAFAYDTFAHPVLETNIRTALIEGFHLGEKDILDGLLYGDLSRLEKHAIVKKSGARVWYYALMDYGAYLKSQKISHNNKSAHDVKQTPFEGSLRQLRAKTLFAIIHQERLPSDERLEKVLTQLLKENYTMKKGKGYVIRS
jgi:A/G-specific adenine glycosylase